MCVYLYISACELHSPPLGWYRMSGTVLLFLQQGMDGLSSWLG